MSQTSSFHRSFCAVLATSAVALAATAGCERVDYYSLTGTVEVGAGGAGTTSSTNLTTSTTGPTVTRGAVLQAAGVCAASLYEGAAAAAASLGEAAATAAQTPDETTKKAARDAWDLAIDRWQQTEIIRVGAAGPAGEKGVAGGKGLRELVYSWPLVSPCLIEQTIVDKSYEKADFSATGLVNKRGLWAAEHLLFNESTGNACSAGSAINATGAWAAMSAADLAERKRAYAAIVTAGAAAQVKLIAGAWSKSGGDFAGELAAAGQGSTLFASDQAALNALSDGLYYLDSDVKDLKLGQPLGIIECEAASCPFESRYARRSRDHIKNNLLGFRKMFEGCDEGGNIGFDDLLVASGAGDLAERMKTYLEGAIAAADALPSADLAEVMVTEPAKVTALHVALKKLTDAMKTELATVLNLELPQTVEGDND